MPDTADEFEYIQTHLTIALEHTSDQEARFNIRQALQHLEKLNDTHVDCDEPRPISE